MKNNDTFLVTFFNNLNKNNINYCVLRNYETLPNNLNGSDLDILISKNDIKKAINTYYDSTELAERAVEEFKSQSDFQEIISSYQILFCSKKQVFLLWSM